MTLHTGLCDALGIKYPIIQAPMMWIAGAGLAAAVSNAGGLGVIAKGTGERSFKLRKEDVESTRSEIRKFRTLSNRPFAVGNPEEPEFMELMVEEKVPIVITALGNPANFAKFYNDHGIKMIHMGSTVKHAKKCESLGCIAYIHAGFEAGGHDPGGRDYVTTFAGIPQVADAVKIPVIAAGGVGDGRGLAAALILGAQGVRMGTRFVATEEGLSHINHKNLIVNATDTATVWMGRWWGDYLRSLHTPYADKLYEMELKAVPVEKILEFMGGEGTADERTLPRRLRGQTDGDVQEGQFHAGQIAGLIKEILPAAEVVRRVVAQAEEILAGAGKKYLK
ncbi:MAG: nitronate monooxygenase [Chloroflexi bacterium]|nr:nitronate monooxygenase [Chloroflexota bacterium]